MADASLQQDITVWSLQPSHLVSVATVDVLCAHWIVGILLASGSPIDLAIGTILDINDVDEARWNAACTTTSASGCGAAIVEADACADLGGH